MKAYDFYFEIGGKKMKTTIIASNRIEADTKFRSKLIVHKCIERKQSPLDGFEDILNMMKP